MLASPIRVTSTPRLRAPSAKARESSGLVSRMSWPMTQAGVALALLGGVVVLVVAGVGGVFVVVVVVGEDDDLGEGRSEGAGDPGVELVRDDAADVVGLHDVGEGDRSHGWRAYGSSGAVTGCGLATVRSPGRLPSGVDGRVTHRVVVHARVVAGPPSRPANDPSVDDPVVPRVCAGCGRAALPAANDPASMTRLSLARVPGLRRSCPPRAPAVPRGPAHCPRRVACRAGRPPRRPDVPHQRPVALEPGTCARRWQARRSRPATVRGR